MKHEKHHKKRGANPSLFVFVFVFVIVDVIP